MGKLYVIGIGPGGEDHFTKKMESVIAECDSIVGYTPYLDYLGDRLEGKILYSTGMKSELKRCEEAIGLAREGNTVAIISTGDAGLYGMAGPIFQLLNDEDTEKVEVEIVPGISSNFAAAAHLGAPIMHDFATVSLSDLLTPWEVIMKRIRAALDGDFVLCLYNPRSKGRPDHLRKVLDEMGKTVEPSRPVGIVKNAGRPGTEVTFTTIGEIDDTIVDMLSMVIIGNSKTRMLHGKMVTPRGYENK